MYRRSPNTGWNINEFVSVSVTVLYWTKMTIIYLMVVLVFDFSNAVCDWMQGHVLVIMRTFCMVFDTVWELGSREWIVTVLLAMLVVCQETSDPIMCSYKLVSVKFEVWGLQTRVEAFVQRVNIHIRLHSFDLISAFKFSVLQHHSNL